LFGQLYVDFLSDRRPRSTFRIRTFPTKVGRPLHVFMQVLMSQCTGVRLINFLAVYDEGAWGHSTNNFFACLQHDRTEVH